MVNDNSQKNKANYFLPEAVPFLMCSAVLAIVLKQNKEAKILFDKIKENCKLPGCEEAYTKIQRGIPEGNKLIKEIVKRSGYSYNKPPDIEGQQIALSKRFMFNTKDLIIHYTKRFTPWVKSDKRMNKDFTELVMSIIDFIKVGFNRDSEQAKGKYKITGFNSDNLVLTIIVMALIEVNKMNMNRLEQLPMYFQGKKIYTIKSVTSGRIPRRVKKSLVKEYMDAGFKLKHDEKLEAVASRWYQCRVVYSGPEEFCREQALKGESLDPANISNEIRECDEAIGYPREKTGKRRN